MTTLTTAPEVARYLDDVRRHLADLPPEERDGLVQDLEDHLAEVAAEHGLPLERRLGEPAAFAAELRASAGLAGAPEPEARRPNAARALVSSVAASPTWQRVRAFLPELRPGWWVLRGYLALAVVTLLGPSADRWPSFPIPALGGNVLLGLLGLAVAVPASVSLGRRALETGRRRWLDRAASALAVLAALVGLGAVQPGASGPWYPPERYFVGGGASLHDAEGRPITNIYAYDKQGNLLEGVLLYDQAGRPLDDVSPVTEDGYPVETNSRLDANGAPVTNAYPLDREITVDPWSRPGYPAQTETMRPPVVVVPPMPTAG